MRRRNPAELLLLNPAATRPSRIIGPAICQAIRDYLGRNITLIPDVEVVDYTPDGQSLAGQYGPAQSIYVEDYGHDEDARTVDYLDFRDMDDAELAGKTVSFMVNKVSQRDGYDPSQWETEDEWLGDVSDSSDNRIPGWVRISPSGEFEIYEGTRRYANKRWRRNPTAHAPRHNPILLRSNAEALRYGTMVADAYLAAPAFDEDEAWRWQVLIKHIEKLFERIQRGKQGVKVVFVAGQPYADERELQEGVDATGILYVSTEFNTHPIFTSEQNLKFRAVHDYMTHIARDLTFGLRGEIAAYNIHAKMAPPDALPALFTEVLGQAVVSVTKGFFPEQKIALLPFDYYNVGIEL